MSVFCDFFGDLHWVNQVLYQVSQLQQSSFEGLLLLDYQDDNVGKYISLMIDILMIEIKN